MYELRKQKTELRETYMAKRSAMSVDERKQKDMAICRCILGSVTYRFADALLFYYPRPSEIDLLPVAKAAMEAGKKVVFPVYHTEDRTMTFYQVDNLDDFTENESGLLSPAHPCEEYVIDKSKRENRICFVPAVLYDKKGFRIGYGGGYYDRFLSSFGGTVLGVTYRDFIVPIVPKGRFDLPVDVLITEGGIYAKG